MKVAMITGSFPPEPCGVGDYTSRLVDALDNRGVQMELVLGKEWGPKGIATLLYKIRQMAPDLVHMQYPTLGYGRSLGPQFLTLFKPALITLHEVSQVHSLRQVSLYPFSIFAQQIVFTTQYEMDYALRYAPWIRKRGTVIPIGTNVGIGNRTDKDSDDIVCFGLIRPNKGLEAVIELASLLKSRSLNLKVRIAGRIDPRNVDYYNYLRTSTKDFPVQWDVELSDHELEELLGRTRVAYAPFPDGASERRSSLLALLSNGVATITTKGAFTPPALGNVVEFAMSPRQALDKIIELLADSPRRARMSRESVRYANGLSWDSIAKKHEEVYRTLIPR